MSSQAGCSSTAQEGASCIPLGSLCVPGGASQQEELPPREHHSAAAAPPASLHTASGFQNLPASLQAAPGTRVKTVMVQHCYSAGSGATGSVIHRAHACTEHRYLQRAEPRPLPRRDGGSWSSWESPPAQRSHTHQQILKPALWASLTALPAVLHFGTTLELRHSKESSHSGQLHKGWNFSFTPASSPAVTLCCQQGQGFPQSTEATTSTNRLAGLWEEKSQTALRFVRKSHPSHGAAELAPAGLTSPPALCNVTSLLNRKKNLSKFSS